MRIIKNSLSLSVVVATVLMGCATPPPQLAERHPHTKTVQFEGIEFRIDSARSMERLPIQRANVYTDPNSRWVAVLVNIKNVTNSPVEVQFHPEFKLRSPSGAEFEENKQMRYLANRETGYSQLQPLNPQIDVKRAILFQVPRGNYAMEVAVPTSISSTLVAMSKRSNRFFFELPNME